MKRIKYILFTFLILSFGTLFVSADCTKEELEELKNEANKIKATYKHLGAVEAEGEVNEYNHFTITFKNVNEDFYISDIYDFKYNLNENDNLISFSITTGKYDFYVVSKKCDVQIKKINVKIPMFNSYSLDPLCEGIDGEDFELCGKYYNSNYEISYDTFKRKVEEYRRTHKIKNEKDNDTKEKISIKVILNKMLDFITNYQLYLVIFLGTLLMILIIMIIIKRKRKRVVLE